MLPRLLPVVGGGLGGRQLSAPPGQCYIDLRRPCATSDAAADSRGRRGAYGCRLLQ